MFSSTALASCKWKQGYFGIMRWPLDASLLTALGMTHDLQQTFPLSQSLLLIPLALERHAGACPMDAERSRSLASARMRSASASPSPGVTVKAASNLLKEACNFSVLGANENRGTAGGGDAIEFARHDQALQGGIEADQVDIPDAQKFPLGAPLVSSFF